MKVETPRTDAMVRKILSDLQSGTMEVVHADFARELERELLSSAFMSKKNTPRTNDQIGFFTLNQEKVSAEFSRQLEREITQLKNSLEYCIKICETNSQVENDLQIKLAKRIAAR
jgi:hypothetical protein